MMDEAFFRATYERYWSRLYSVCYFTIGSREAAEDAVTEVFMSLWNNRDRQVIENMDHYLVRAAKNLSLKYLIRQRKMDQALLRMVDTLQDHHRHSDPERPLEVKEITAMARKTLDSLPEKTRSIFLMNREEGLTYQQIAERTGLSVKSVEYHVSRALRALSQSLLVILLECSRHTSGTI
ncbi:RNA polymerase sigma-70 factor [Chitinophaga deserti]|uniref:RNA polymerase sigma-70 factor n=1 Tax=Chitinophaga deserti TaxID=2164099 RepID=UPI000D6C8CCE|nr:RNA polymerase sigma-70 factor [Chitinophaga deserti]